MGGGQEAQVRHKGKDFAFFIDSVALQTYAEFSCPLE